MKKGFLITNGIALFFAIVSVGWLVYGAVSPAALKNMNGVYHGATDYVIFNDTTRKFGGLEPIDCLLLLGAFNKTDPAHWRVNESLQLLPPKDLQRATEGVFRTM